MELYQLRAFLEVAQHGSFTRAAERLHCSQPAITRQIGALEAELGSALFERAGRVSSLTEAGKALHPHAVAIVGLQEQAREAVTLARSGEAGAVRIGATNTLATYALPPIIRGFLDHHSRIELSVRTGPTAQVIDRVAHGQDDLGVISGPCSDNRLVVREVSSLVTVVVCSPNHALASLPRVRAVDLAQYPLLLMPNGASLRTVVDALLQTEGEAVRAAMEMDNVESIKRMVEVGLGISLLPAIAVEAETSAGRLAAIPLDPLDAADRPILLVSSRKRSMSPAARHVLNSFANGLCDTSS
jgi:DNA-binding transcriptional LysR family regulator